ncbi:hypothetical protein FJZ36_12660 [Candidatus Poribacteria bacterium]|nr:hypothetical protein [Candidatus Poribacteria bacterium]
MGLSARWRNVVVLTVSLAILALWSFRLAGDVRAYRAARALKSAREAELERLTHQREAAREYVHKLRTDRQTQERMVRAKGYARPNEEIYVILPATPKTETSTTPAPSPETR